MRKLLIERIEVEKNNLAYGASIKSFEAYREMVGMIRGLHEAIDMLDDAETKASERERGV
jgi:hypothetical protein